MMNDQSNEGQLKIELSDEIAEGTYANLAVMAHSTSEFIVDFIRVMPGVPKASVKSRIILAPEHAKRLLYALGDNIKRYERENGEIRLREEINLPPMGPIKGEA